MCVSQTSGLYVAFQCGWKEAMCCAERAAKEKIADLGSRLISSK